METLVERGVPTPSLEGMLASEELLSTFDVGDIATEALLFQTGYLTVTGIETRGEGATTGWAIRIGRCARASTRACWATW